MSSNAKSSTALTALVGIATTLTIGVTILATRVAFFKEGDSEGWWHARTIDGAAVLAPASILLFAAGVSWLRQRRWLLAALALPALPTWCLVLRGVDTILANDFWFLIVGMQLQGIKPFGVS